MLRISNITKPRLWSPNLIVAKFQVCLWKVYSIEQVLLLNYDASWYLPPALSSSQQPGRIRCYIKIQDLHRWSVVFQNGHCTWYFVSLEHLIQIIYYSICSKLPFPSNYSRVQSVYTSIRLSVFCFF